MSALYCGCDPEAKHVCEWHSSPTNPRYDHATQLEMRILTLKSISGWQAKVYEINASNGFHDDPIVDETGALGKRLLLVVEELTEAYAELRANRAVTETYYTETPQGLKPEGFGVELADAVIRILDIAERWGIDLQGLMAEKTIYNAKRGYKHGKQF